jgi:hypothetical protein
MDGGFVDVEMRWGGFAWAVLRRQCGAKAGCANARLAKLFRTSFPFAGRKVWFCLVDPSSCEGVAKETQEQYLVLDGIPRAVVRYPCVGGAARPLRGWWLVPSSLRVGARGFRSSFGGRNSPPPPPRAYLFVF